MPELSRFLMEELELPLIEVVADIEENGYPVDAQFFHDLRQQLEPQRAEILAQLQGIAGTDDFNPDSGPQVAALLYGTLGFPVQKRTEKGQPSTDKAAMEAIDHEAARLLQRYRTLAKITNTYCKIPDQVGDDGRLHVEFNQLGTETGRFTSSSIIQTLPKADEFGIRKGFCAAPGYRIIAADFDQQELRVLAGVSGDQTMLAAIRDSVDLHGLAAVKVFGLDCMPNDVAEQYPEERQRVKAIQFGLIYGRSAVSLAEALAISRDDARKLQDDYFAQFPAVRQLVERVHEQVARDGSVTDLFGRGRQLPNAQKQRPRKKYENMTDGEQKLVSQINAAKRQAQNFVIQGPAATITKLAMLRCHAHLKADHPSIKMIVQVHDELHFEVPDVEVAHFAAELPGLMCELDLARFNFNVPMAVSLEVGQSWGELRHGGPDDERKDARPDADGGLSGA